MGKQRLTVEPITRYAIVSTRFRRTHRVGDPPDPPWNESRPMTTRRQFVQGIPAFAVAANMLDGDAAPAAPAPVAPAAGHFHPKGKPPSEFTKAVLRQARQSLPFDDTRDFDEQRKGLVAPLKELTVKTEAGDVVWDMTRFQFLDQKDEFDTVHPSMHRIGQLNNNYGLYEVIPGIYQVRGLDLTQTTIMRGKTN